MSSAFRPWRSGFLTSAPNSTSFAATLDAPSPAARCSAVRPSSAHASGRSPALIRRSMRHASPAHAAARSRPAPPSSADEADPPAFISSEAQSSLPAFCRIYGTYTYRTFALLVGFILQSPIRRLQNSRHTSSRTLSWQKNKIKLRAVTRCGPRVDQPGG